jgi:hypothetical protein
VVRLADESRVNLWFTQEDGGEELDGAELLARCAEQYGEVDGLNGDTY